MVRVRKSSAPTSAIVPYERAIWSPGRRSGLQGIQNRFVQLRVWDVCDLCSSMRTSVRDCTVSLGRIDKKPHHLQRLGRLRGYFQVFLGHNAAELSDDRRICL